MKKRFSFMLIICSLVLISTQADLYGQTGPMYPLTGSNKAVHGDAANSPTLTDDYLFGFSSDDLNNVLVINGINVPYYDQGWFNGLGEHGAGNNNYFCGTFSGLSFWYRNYFTFDFSNLSSYGITLPITTVTLKVVQYECYPFFGTRSYELREVTSSPAVIDQNYSGEPAALAVYNDLGDGPLYATANVDRTLPYSAILEVPLNATGVAAANAAVGSFFVLGGRIDDTTPPPMETPVSGWALGLGIALILGVAIFRMRRMV